MIKNKGRLCTNCGAVYKNVNITICLKCGHVTRDNVVTKGGDSEDSLGEQLRPDRERSGLLDTSEEIKGSIRKK